MLKLPEVVYKMAAEFTEYRLFTTSTITRNSYETFSKTLKTFTVNKNNKVMAIEVNRRIINSLFSFINKGGKPINFETVLKYPLSPVPLSIVHADDITETQTKQKLNEIIYK